MVLSISIIFFFFFFFNDTATTEIYTRKDTLSLHDALPIRASTLVWTAGTAPNPLVARLPLPNRGGRVLVNEYLEVPGWPGVWALGDCALVPDARTGGFHPPTAQHALREGRVAARNAAAAVRGGRKKPFRFKTLGQLAAIGDGRASPTSSG